MSRRLADPRLAIARRDLASLKDEKTIVLALAIQLFVAAFSSFLVVGLTSLYDPGSVAAQGVEVGVAGEASEELLAAVRRHDGTSAVAFEDAATAREAFRTGRVDAVLIGSDAPPPDDSGGSVVRVEAIAPEGSIQSTLIVVQLREVLETVERTERRQRAASLETRPLALPAGADASPYFGFTYTILLPLLLFLPPFISGSVAVDVVTEEIEQGTLELLRVAPLSLVDVVDGKGLAMVALAPAQAALWLGLLAANGIGVAHPLELLVMVTAVATVVVALGVGLAVRIGRRKPAQLLYSLAALTLFGLAIGLPEHPATTVAKLAVDSATALTLGHVAAYVIGAAVAVIAIRRLVARVPAESLQEWAR